MRLNRLSVDYFQETLCVLSIQSLSTNTSSENIFWEDNDDGTGQKESTTPLSKVKEENTSSNQVKEENISQLNLEDENLSFN